MDPKLKAKIDKRQEANREILRAVSAMVEAHPDLRFHQILQNLKVSQTEMIEMSEVLAGDPMIQVGKDLFYEESTDTLQRMKS